MNSVSEIQAHIPEIKMPPAVDAFSAMIHVYTRLEMILNESIPKADTRAELVAMGSIIALTIDLLDRENFDE